MLIAKNLNKTYKMKISKGLFKKREYKEIQAVKSINLQIKKGEIVGLIGLNGAGKSTTIKMLGGILSPDSGEVILDDIDVVKNHRIAKSKINIVTGGERNIYWRLSAYENLKYFGSLYGIPKKELETRIEELLRITALFNEKDIPLELYSKGMKQRLQIARGLINDPSYLFLDEPTLGLDVDVAKEMRSYLKKIINEKEKGALLTTHYLTEAEELCQYIYIINKGEIIAEGTQQELKKTLTTEDETIINLDENINLPQLLREDLEKKRIILTKDIKNKYLSMQIGCENVDTTVKALLENNIKICSMFKKEPSLEDALIEIVARDVVHE